MICVGGPLVISLLPPFCRQEPLHRIGQETRGAPFSFPRRSCLNHIICPYFSVAVLNCKLLFIFLQQFSESWPYIDVTEIEPP